MNSDAAGDVQVVAFGLGSEVCALPIAVVREVRRFEALTPLPDSPPYVAGVLHLRGKMLAVIDLGARMGKKSGEWNDKTRILIARLSQTWVGLIADDVQGVVTVPQGKLQPPPAAGRLKSGDGVVSAIFQGNGHVVMLLDPQSIVPQQRSNEFRSPVPSPKILLVDDSRTIQVLFKGLFEKSGYEVSTATDGESALKMAAEQKPNLIVLDGLLPKVDGFEVCRRLRLDDRTKSAKIVMLTGGAEGNENQRSREAGADCFLSKNAEPAAILDLVKELLARPAG